MSRQVSSRDPLAYELAYVEHRLPHLCVRSRRRVVTAVEKSEDRSLPPVRHAALHCLAVFTSPRFGGQLHGVIRPYARARMEVRPPCSHHLFVVALAALALTGCGEGDDPAATKEQAPAAPRETDEVAGDTLARQAAQELEAVDTKDRWRVKKVEWGFADGAVVVQTGLPTGADTQATGICTSLLNPTVEQIKVELVQVFASDGSEIEPPACAPR